MFGIGNCIGDSTASQVVCLLFTVLTISIFARAILSWFNMDPRSPIIQALDSVTEPILEPIRRIMPRLGMIDLSPLVAIILLQFVSGGLQQFFG
jgi:YggT family protein